MSTPPTVIVLAAGEGTRMRSSKLPKVLHGFAGRTLLGHVLHATGALGADRTVVVVGHRRAEVAAHLADIAPHAEPVAQDDRNGTGHAVRLALDAVPEMTRGTVVVVPGDRPLLTGEALAGLVAAHEASGAAATALTGADPDAGGLPVASGVYAIAVAPLREAVAGEAHLGDVIGRLAAAGHPVGAFAGPPGTTAGVDDRVQLAAAHRAYNTRLVESHMRAGVTVIDPLTTWIDAGVTIGPDVTLRPSVELRGATRIGAGASIGPQVTLSDTAVGANADVSRTVATGARIGAGATVGPYAHLRPGTVLADGAHIGSFVELKNAEIGAGTKVPHLSYVGDATIGEHSNIGGATVFVNYDGVAKHRTVIGSHVRTGADNMFVAPVTVGDGAYTAAGSVITRDVPPGAMGVARANQRNVAGWVARMRPGTPADEAATRALKDEGTNP